MITGIPIEETVAKLMAVAARPRELVASRTQAIDAERLAITKLTSLVLAFEFEANKLSSSSLFDRKTATSSDPESLKAVLTEDGNPAVGNYKFRPLQTAAAQQLASSSLQSVADLSNDGTFKFGFGGFVDKGIALSELNGGAGVRAGTIRITDRAGDAVDIDLRTARSVDDVIRAINSNTAASVTASVNGDQLVLTDTSGGSGNLKVQEVGNGKTALDLGIAGLNVAANTATGADVFRLHAVTKLTSLNDGTGVPLASGNDLSISLADETSLDIDLGAATTLGDVLTALNEANPTKLSAAIAADGNRIELTDLTPGAGAPVIEADNVSKWFGDVGAVSDVSFAIGPGVTALLGMLASCAAGPMPASGSSMAIFTGWPGLAFSGIGAAGACRAASLAPLLPRFVLHAPSTAAHMVAMTARLRLRPRRSASRR